MARKDEALPDPTVADIAVRLERSLKGQVDPGVVEATVRRCAAEFRDARIAVYVPLLVEARSRARWGAWLGGIVGDPAQGLLPFVGQQFGRGPPGVGASGSQVVLPAG